MFALHEVYSDEATRSWVVDGCRSAGIGCIDCKMPLIEAVNADYPQIEIVAVSNSGNFIERSIANVARSVLYGGLLSILVLLTQIPAGRLGRLEDVVAAVLFLASPGAAYITGQVLHVNGGMYT